MKVEFAERSPSERHTETAVAVCLFDALGLSADAQGVVSVSDGAPLRIARRRKFTGASGDVCEIAGAWEGAPHGLLLIGLGHRDKVDDLALEDAAARAQAAAAASGAAILEVRLSDFSPTHAAHAALGVLLSAYRFDRYRTPKETNADNVLEGVRVITADPKAAERAFEPLLALADGVRLARDLVSEPPNILGPEAFSDRIRALEHEGLTITVLGEPELRALGMGAMLGVGQGSRQESRLVICRWDGASDPDAAPIAFVGKGVTFDSGGLSLKPAKDMERMKNDMGGAAAVAGAMLTLARRRARVNAVGVLGLVENMPDGNAQRPGDVVTSMSGQTIEVINTDAEGRLVLADALWYTQEKLKPKVMIDLATLTGHASYGLGDDYATLLSNDDELAQALLAAGAAEADPLWRLPLVAAYDKLHDTPVADMKNIGGHPEAGAITAALFLQRFVRNIAWAHLDIASVAWRTRKDRPTIPEGATGYGVRVLNRLAADAYEEKKS